MASQKNISMGGYNDSQESSLVAGFTAADKGRVWYNNQSNQIKYYNGTGPQVLGVAGSGLTSLNGLTGSTQTFSTNTATGTAPTWNSNGTDHELKIPMANAGGVTAGLISNAELSGIVSTLSGKISAETDPTVRPFAQAALPTCGAGSVLTGNGANFSCVTLSQSQITGTLDLTKGGTNASLSAVNGGVVYSGNTSLGITSAGSSGQILRSAGAAAPAWSSATYPATTTANAILYSTAANTIGELAPTASSLLTTDGSSAPSWTALNSDFAPQYAKLSGRAGGQTLYGSNAASESLILESTSNGTKGSVFINPNGGNVGIGTTNPGARLEVAGTGAVLVPRGNDTERPTGTNGMFRYNSGREKFEAFENGGWKDMISAGGSSYTLNGDAATAWTIGVVTVGSAAGLTGPDIQNASPNHTLRFPAAEDSGVTAGLVSHSTLTTFTSSITERVSKYGDYIYGSLTFPVAGLPTNVEIQNNGGFVAAYGGASSSVFPDGVSLVNNGSTSAMGANINGAWVRRAGEKDGAALAVGGPMYLDPMVMPTCASASDEGLIFVDNADQALKMCIYSNFMYKWATIAHSQNSTQIENRPRPVISSGSTSQLSLEPVNGYNTRIQFGDGTLWSTTSVPLVSTGTCGGPLCFYYAHSMSGPDFIYNQSASMESTTHVGLGYSFERGGYFTHASADKNEFLAGMEPVLTVAPSGNILLIGAVDKNLPVKVRFDDGDQMFGDYFNYNNQGSLNVGSTCSSGQWCYVYAQKNGGSARFYGDSQPPTDHPSDKFIAAVYRDQNTGRYRPDTLDPARVAADGQLRVVPINSVGFSIGVRPLDQIYQVRVRFNDGEVRFANSGPTASPVSVNSDTVACSANAWCYVYGHKNGPYNVDLLSSSDSPSSLNKQSSDWVYIGSLYWDGSNNRTLATAKDDQSIDVGNTPTLEYNNASQVSIRARAKGMIPKFRFPDGTVAVGSGPSFSIIPSSSCFTNGAWCYIYAGYDPTTRMLTYSADLTPPSDWSHINQASQRYIGAVYRDPSGNVANFRQMGKVFQMIKAENYLTLAGWTTGSVIDISNKVPSTAESADVELQVAFNTSPNCSLRYDITTDVAGDTLQQWLETDYSSSGVARTYNKRVSIPGDGAGAVKFQVSASLESCGSVSFRSAIVRAFTDGYL